MRAIYASSATVATKDSGMTRSAPVAANSGLGSRPCSSPVATTSTQQSGTRVFLVEDDLPPSTQLDVLPTVGPASTSSLVQTEHMLLPEVALPVSQIRLKTAYDLLRLLRQFSCSHPGVLGTTTASVQLPPVRSSPHVYQVPPPSSS